jgi:hypothetical protein
MLDRDPSHASLALPLLTQCLLLGVQCGHLTLSAGDTTRVKRKFCTDADAEYFARQGL